MRTVPALFALFVFGCGSEEIADCDPHEMTSEADAPTFAFTPDTASPGDIFITSLVSDSDEIDYSAIADLIFYGDDVDCTPSARDDELLATIALPDDAAEGEVDMVILFEDGETIWVEGALNIVAAP